MLAQVFSTLLKFGDCRRDETIAGMLKRQGIPWYPNAVHPSVGAP
jgi:hypothetical protein